MITRCRLCVHIVLVAYPYVLYSRYASSEMLNKCGGRKQAESRGMWSGLRVSIVILTYTRVYVNGK